MSPPKVEERVTYVYDYDVDDYIDSLRDTEPPQEDDSNFYYDEFEDDGGYDY